MEYQIPSIPVPGSSALRCSKVRPQTVESASSVRILAVGTLQKVTRITSYNVCYTKLLREHLRAELPGTGIDGIWYSINPAIEYGDETSNNTWATVPSYGYHSFYWIESTGPALTPGFCNDTAGPLTIRFIEIPVITSYSIHYTKLYEREIRLLVFLLYGHRYAMLKLLLKPVLKIFRLMHHWAHIFFIM